MKQSSVSVRIDINLYDRIESDIVRCETVDT